MRVSAPRFLATAQIAGMSCISKVSEPGDSTTTAVVFARNSFSMPAPARGS